MTVASEMYLVMLTMGGNNLRVAGYCTVAAIATAAMAALVLRLRRYIAVQENDLNLAREREAFFQTMADGVPEIMWTADPNGAVDYCNRIMTGYSGLLLEQLQGETWTAAIHSDDRALCLEKWKEALRTGEPLVAEYRLRARDGSFRWFLCRANPIRNDGKQIMKWFGTCTDIEDQKQNQQILERQILQRTEQLAETNARLQQEMLEKDRARKQLDQQNENMMRDLEKRSERATLLAKMGELLQSCINRKEVIAAAVGFAPKIFPAARGALALLNPSRSVAEIVGSWSDCQLPSMEFESSECWALRTAHAHLVAAGDSTARCSHAAGVTGSYLCIPILAQGETLGILHLQAASGGQLEHADLSLKTTFAGQVGLSIANIRLREALRTQSVRDPLTGLYNRRYLEELLEREIRRAGRATQSLGIIMIDLDHFKTFNDTYGHDAGDAVLREAGAFLVKGIRAEDYVCRYGGEEFVVVLPTANLEVSRARADKMRTKMKELTVLYQGRSMGMLTISAGVAVFPENGTSPRELMTAADAALYEAKRGGRDQVVAASPKGSEDVFLSDVARSAWG